MYPLLDRYETWQKPLGQYLADNLVRVNWDGYTLEQFERGYRELDAALKAEGDLHPDLFCLFEQLCSQYLSGDSTGRSEIRARVAARRELGGLIHSYAAWLATQINHLQDIAKLRLALAAVLIENCGSDYRDILTILADLYVTAEEAGMEPKRLFDSMSDLATDSPTAGGCESVAQMLREFDSYAIVDERRRMGRPRPGISGQAGPSEGANTDNGERSSPGGRDDWRVRIAVMVGVAVCMVAAMILGPVVGINGFWPGTLAIVVAIVVGSVLGRVVGGLLFRPSFGGPPDHRAHA